ncbi:hypothetical protein [Andreprevotia chitinilytica]|uniref:hypothetical protein n=1 Tax=Andreprevotia chitinilytica TaxID=396808 RepID=UPI00054F5632|nr:hypothetical protein [Andreprevotia chitinilytica]
MSDTPEKSATDDAEAAAPSGGKRWLLPALIGGGVVLLLLALFVGVGLGMAKRQFERKSYVDQIAKLKIALQDTDGLRKEAEGRIEKMREDLKEKRDEIHNLELKLDEAKQAVDHHAQQESPSQASAVAAAVTPPPANSAIAAQLSRKGDCVLTTGQKGTDWKNCLATQASGPTDKPGAAKKAEH